MTQVTNKPVAEITDRDIKIAIWGNPRKDGKGTRYSAGSPVRSYKDANGNWKETSYFAFNEVLRIQRIVGKVADKIEELYRSDRS